MSLGNSYYHTTLFMTESASVTRSCISCAFRSLGGCNMSAHSIASHTRTMEYLQFEVSSFHRLCCRAVDFDTRLRIQVCPEQAG